MIRASEAQAHGADAGLDDAQACPRCGDSRYTHQFGPQANGFRVGVQRWSCANCGNVFDVPQRATPTEQPRLKRESPTACGICGRDEGNRYRCPRADDAVLCRDCCVVRFDGHNCPWWRLCDATNLKRWEQR